MAKPDDRSDNVEKMQRSVQNTIENFREAKDYLEEHAEEISGEETSRIREKNQNRKQSIRSMREEIKDEANRD